MADIIFLGVDYVGVGSVCLLAAGGGDGIYKKTNGAGASVSSATLEDTIERR